MNTTFTEYFQESNRDYNYTIKIACDKVTEEMADKIEQSLSKLDIVSMSNFQGTPIQESPLDFPNVSNTSVFMAEFAVKYPSSSDMLERMVSEATGLQRTFVTVYTENDPRKTYTEEYLARKDPSFKDNYETKLGKDDFSDEECCDTPAYGDEYNDVYLGNLASMRQDRETVEVTNSLIPKQKVEVVSRAKMGEPGTQSPFTKETRD